MNRFHSGIKKNRVKVLVTALLLVLFTGSASMAASGKGEVKQVFIEKTAVCQVVAPYLEKCELKEESAAALATVEGTLPRTVGRDSVVLLKGSKAGKIAGKVVDCTGLDGLEALAAKAAEDELAGKSALVWVDPEGKRAALIELDDKKGFEPGEKVKIKAKRKAPVVEGC